MFCLKWHFQYNLENIWRKPFSDGPMSDTEEYDSTTGLKVTVSF